MTDTNLDWKNLSFGYIRTDFNIRSYFRDGAWTKPELTSDETVTMHMAATALHYGQEAFEGQKAFRGADGKIRIFRIDENAKRLRASADYLKMAMPPVELFTDMVRQVVRANERFVPPYGTGASLYIRPVLFGTGPQVGVKPASEYLLIVFVTPVGPYYKEGFNPIRVIIDRDHDRAAPLGTGHIKAGGNYGASLTSAEIGHEKGYPSVLYLDAKEKKHIDECGAANFFAIFQKFLGELPKPNELGAIRNRKVALLNSFFRHLIGDQVITQILFDFDAFEASISGENGKRFVIDNGVKRNDRTDQSFV